MSEVTSSPERLVPLKRWECLTIGCPNNTGGKGSLRYAGEIADFYAATHERIYPDHETRVWTVDYTSSSQLRELDETARARFFRKDKST